MTDTKKCRSLAVHHGLLPYGMAHVLCALSLSDEDLRELASENLACFDVVDDDDANNLSGHSGWLAWWPESGTATFVRNAGPDHVEGVDSLESALKAAQGDLSEGDRVGVGEASLLRCDCDETVEAVDGVGYTLDDWLAAAGNPDTHYDLRAAWRAGEDPADYVD